MKEKAILVILDGWGLNDNPKVSALAKAKTPYYDSLIENYPNARLTTFGEDVGLPEGQMGNSEVGHLNIGAGRVVFQELARINNEIQSGDFFKNPILLNTFAKAKQEGKKVHIMGLLSDGGVHAHINHLKAVCDFTEKEGLKEVFIHAFLDGRDTSPNGGVKYLEDLLNYIRDKEASLASIVGRYYAMDRDTRWERTKVAYDLLVNRMAETFTDKPLGAVQQQYEKDITDEFMPPILVDTGKEPKVASIESGDVVLFINFRTDRPRQLTHVLTQEDIEDHHMKKLDLHYVTMTMYDESFKNLHVVYTKENLVNTLGEVLEQKKRTQVRIAETEKYPHVTFFFNGGKEEPFNGEERIMVPSPKVATYDLQPEMSAHEITEALLNHLEEKHPDFAVINYANTDMVGHTGDFSAAVKAAETVDQCISSLIEYAKSTGYHIIVIADHGNSDIMVNEDGSPHTAHTTNLVPIIYIREGREQARVNDGKLADIATTILSLLNEEIPDEMTGDSLVH